MSAPEQTLNGTTVVIGKFHRVRNRHAKRLVEMPPWRASPFSERRAITARLAPPRPATR
jgi:hypothetical protein